MCIETDQTSLVAQTAHTRAARSRSTHFTFTFTLSIMQQMRNQRYIFGNRVNRRVAEIQIFEKTYLIVIKDETGLKFKMNDSTLFLIGSYAQKLVASY